MPRGGWLVVDPHLPDMVDAELAHICALLAAGEALAPHAKAARENPFDAVGARLLLARYRRQTTASSSSRERGRMARR